jgi:succinate-semialdehyde dehydrogenase/glutarate-semialdehyde dehydrogenase
MSPLLPSLPWLTAERLARWRASVAVPQGRSSIEVCAPFTGVPLPPVPRGEADDVRVAVDRARAVQPAWAATPPRERARVLLRLHDRVLRLGHEAMDLVQVEAGKARLDAFEEVADSANVARHYGVHAPSLLADRRRTGALPLLTFATESRRPRGVVGFIVPWNYPLNLALTDAIAALVAGNAAVLRPDPQTTMTALWALEQLCASGLPRDVLTVVTGEGPEIGPPLVGAVDYVMFTGSTATGRAVAEGAARRLVDLSLELGGKNPMIVRADADVEAAARAAVRGCFIGAGQVCVSMERIYVHRSIEARFLEVFTAHARALRFCTAPGWDGDVGSLVNARQLERVASHVDQARAGGAIVHAGGRARPDVGPFFYEPTILGGVTPAMTLYATETFGPVVSVYPVDDDGEAVAAANATPYGLTASVWTRDTAAGRALAARLQAGSVGVNDVYAATWGSVDAAIGGMKASGLGRRHGRDGLLKFTEPQTVAVQRLLPLSPPAGVPPKRWATILTWALTLRRHIPGLRCPHRERPEAGWRPSS